MDKETMNNICEIIKVITPLIILILSIGGFVHVNNQVDDMNYDINNIHTDVHEIQDIQLQNMSDEQLNDYKGHLDEDEARDLESRMRVYLNN